MLCKCPLFCFCSLSVQSSFSAWNIILNMLNALTIYHSLFLLLYYSKQIEEYLTYKSDIIMFRHHHVSVLNALKIYTVFFFMFFAIQSFLRGEEFYLQRWDHDGALNPLTIFCSLTFFLRSSLPSVLVLFSSNFSN